MHKTKENGEDAVFDPKSVEEPLAVRISVPAIFVSVLLALIVVVVEISRALSLHKVGKLASEAAPTYADQIANNAVLLASTAVSAFLVILTYSLFRKTNEALTIASSQSKISKQSLRLLEKQIALETSVESRRTNPFLELDADQMRYSDSKRRAVAKSDSGGYRIGSVLTWNAGSEAAAQRAHEQEPNDTILWVQNEFILSLPVKNKGLGPAIDVKVKINLVSWAKVWLQSSTDSAVLSQQTVIFDRIGRRSAEGDLGSENLSLKETQLENLLLGDDKVWTVDVRIPLGDTLPVELGATEVFNEDELVEIVEFNSDLLFGNAFGQEASVADGKVTFLEPRKFQADPEKVEHFTQLYARQKRLPLGLEVEIEYASINYGADAGEKKHELSNKSELDSKRELNRIGYVILFTEIPIDNAPSELRWDVRLRDLKNGILEMDRGRRTPVKIALGPLVFSSLEDYDEAVRHLKSWYEMVFTNAASNSSASQAAVEAAEKLRASLLSERKSTDDINTVWKRLGMSQCYLDNLSDVSLRVIFDSAIIAALAAKQ